MADRDAGAKYRRRADGSDYYGILRRTAGVPAVLAEAAFISNAPEEALLADPAFQAVEAQALTDAIVRYVSTTDPGSGFVEPYRGPSRRARAAAPPAARTPRSADVATAHANLRLKSRNDAAVHPQVDRKGVGLRRATLCDTATP